MPSFVWDAVPLRLSRVCLDAMANLTLNDREYGGVLHTYPRADGVCGLTATRTRLIHGTAAEADHMDADLYGAAAAEPIDVASTPFTAREIVRHESACGGDLHINAVFHTHPLFHSHIPGVWSPCPPSIGDVVAHLILGNVANLLRHGQINAMFVMAFEGLYHYTVSADRLLQENEWLYQRLTPEERRRAPHGQYPPHVVDALKARVFSELNPGMEEFYAASDALVSRLGGQLLYTGAVRVGHGRWDCDSHGTCEGPPNLTFPAARARGHRDIVHFLRNNAFRSALQQGGFDYAFYPAPFTRPLDVTLDATK